MKCDLLKQRFVSSVMKHQCKSCSAVIKINTSALCIMFSLIMALIRLNSLIKAIYFPAIGTVFSNLLTVVCTTRIQFIGNLQNLNNTIIYFYNTNLAIPKNILLYEIQIFYVRSKVLLYRSNKNNLSRYICELVFHLENDEIFYCF